MKLPKLSRPFGCSLTTIGTLGLVLIAVLSAIFVSQPAGAVPLHAIRPQAKISPQAGGQAFVGHLVLPGHNAEWCLGLPADAEGGARFVITRCGEPGFHQVFIANRFRGSMLVGLANLPWVIGSLRGSAVVAINSEKDPGHTRWLVVVNKNGTTLWSMAAYWLRGEPAIQFPESVTGNKIYGLNFGHTVRGWQPWISFFGHWRVTDHPANSAVLTAVRKPAIYPEAFRGEIHPWGHPQFCLTAYTRYQNGSWMDIQQCSRGYNDHQIWIGERAAGFGFIAPAYYDVKIGQTGLTNVAKLTDPNYADNHLQFTKTAHGSWVLILPGYHNWQLTMLTGNPKLGHNYSGWWIPGYVYPNAWDHQWNLPRWYIP